MLSSIECVFMDFRGMRGDWGFVFECPTCTQVLRGPFKLCQVCGSIFWVGSRDFYAHIWELWRHFGHMGCMLDSDWSRKFLLRCDWSVPSGAPYTTHDAWPWKCGYNLNVMILRINLMWQTYYNRSLSYKQPLGYSLNFTFWVVWHYVFETMDLLQTKEMNLRPCSWQ